MGKSAQDVYDYLSGLGIPYETVEHPAVYTIEEVERLGLEEGEQVAKNLFLQDNKGTHFYILVLQGGKRADLKALRQTLGTTPLRFASEEKLLALLGLIRGAVTPFGVLNDEDRKVTVLIDEDLLTLPKIGVHPNENTATIYLAPADLERAVKSHGNPWLPVAL